MRFLRLSESTIRAIQVGVKRWARRTEGMCDDMVRACRVRDTGCLHRSQAYEARQVEGM